MLSGIEVAGLYQEAVAPAAGARAAGAAVRGRLVCDETSSRLIAAALAADLAGLAFLVHRR